MGFGLAAYGLWGFAPLFWHLLTHVGPFELIAHRIVWGFGFFFVWCAATRQLGPLRSVITTPGYRRRLVLSASCVSLNWFIFVYAVMVDRVLDVSLGYFINPLVSVAMGRFILRERLRPLQLVAVLIAAVGVSIVALSSDDFPWIALALAGSFGTYGLIRKTTPVSPLTGSTFETLVLLPVALSGLIWMSAQGEGHLLIGEPLDDLWLLSTGPVTAIPLLLFVNAARRLPLSTLGFIQYIAPSLQFILAVFALDEHAPPSKLLAFGIVWAALVVFSVDMWRRTRTAPDTPATPSK